MTDVELEHSWRRIRTELRDVVPDAAWHVYLDGLDARRLDGSTLVVAAPDASRAWVTERFGRLLQSAAQRVLGQDVAIRLVGPEDPVAVSDAAAPASRSPWTAADVPFNARFTRLRSTAPPTRRETDSPSRGPSSRSAASPSARGNA